MRAIRHSAAITVALLLSACGDTTEPRMVATVQLSHSSVTLQHGETTIVEVTLLDQHGAVFDDLPQGAVVTWQSSHPDIVTVSGGTITGVGGGQATISATANGLTPAQVLVTVVNAPTVLSVSPNTLRLDPEDTATLTAVIRSESGSVMQVIPPGYEITWTSSDPGVATVEAGVVTAVSAGQVTIRVEAGRLAPVEIPVNVVLSDGTTFQFAFDYTGDHQGGVSIVGDHVGTPVNGTWAVTYFVSGNNSQYVEAQRRRGPDGSFDILLFRTGGSVPFPITRYGGDVLLILGYYPENSAYERMYTGGSVFVDYTHVADTHLRGRFNFGNMENVNSGARLDIISGTFNVPLVSPPENASPSDASTSSEHEVVPPLDLRAIFEERRGRTLEWSRK